MKTFVLSIAALAIGTISLACSASTAGPEALSFRLSDQLQAGPIQVEFERPHPGGKSQWSDSFEPAELAGTGVSPPCWVTGASSPTARSRR